MTFKVPARSNDCEAHEPNGNYDFRVFSFKGLFGGRFFTASIFLFFFFFCEKRFVNERNFSGVILCESRFALRGWNVMKY